MANSLRLHLFFGLHLFRVVECLRAGFASKAASWIERELGEVHGDMGYGMIDPESLLFDPGVGVWFDLFAETQAGMDGGNI